MYTGACADSKVSKVSPWHMVKLVPVGRKSIVSMTDSPAGTSLVRTGALQFALVVTPRNPDALKMKRYVAPVYKDR